MFDRKLMGQLVDILNDASKKYYDGQECMSDKEFDDLYDKLQKMEKDTGIVLPNSPTVNVGTFPVAASTKVVHEYKSLSLDKTKERDEVTKWLGDRTGVLSWKCDGLTVILTYDNGRLVRGATRGDGAIGEDITHNVVNFQNVPRRIKDPRHIVIRGEAVMPYERFESINATLPVDKRYKNPRNMAAGAAKTLDPSRTADYGVRFIPFDVANATELGFTKLSQALIFVDSLGIETVNWTMVKTDTVYNEIDRRESSVPNLDYPTDGLVIVYDDLYLHKDLGATRRYPRYALAFKWRDKLVTTTIRSVDWSVAKSGLVSPVAIFDPVELEGTTVRRAGLHNLSIIKELALGIGDRVQVYKANMIIPQIYTNLDRTDNVEIPTSCPICGCKLDRRLGANNKSEFLYCVNDGCPARK